MIIISGASQGIGKEATKLFLDKGFEVLAFSRNIANIGLNHKNLHKKSIDVTDEEEVKKVIDNVKKIDLIVCNAGVGYFEKLENTPTQKFEEMFNTNVKGVFFMLKYAMPKLRKQNKGQIIVISSMASKTSVPIAPIYASTKWALQGMCYSLKQDIRDTKIKMGLILPGSVKTNFFEKAGFENNSNRMLEAQTIAQNIYALFNQPQDSDIDEIVVRPSNSK